MIQSVAKERLSKQVTFQLRLKSVCVCRCDGQPLRSAKWDDVIILITSLLPSRGEGVKRAKCGSRDTSSEPVS